MPVEWAFDQWYRQKPADKSTCTLVKCCETRCHRASFEDQVHDRGMSPAAASSAGRPLSPHFAFLDFQFLSQPKGIHHCLGSASSETQVKVHIIQGQRSETTLLTHLTSSLVEILACGGHLKKWPGLLGDGSQITEGGCKELFGHGGLVGLWQSTKVTQTGPLYEGKSPHYCLSFRNTFRGRPQPLPRISQSGC